MGVGSWTCTGLPASYSVCRLRSEDALDADLLTFVPKTEMRTDVAAEGRGAFDSPTRPEAERQLGIAVTKSATTAPKLAEWPERNVPEGLTVFALPDLHLGGAVLMEIREDRDTNRKHLTMEPG